MKVRGIRGAINTANNNRGEIFTRTQELLRAMLAANRVREKEIAAAFFTMTPDLNADFPAYAARDMGWKDVPMMCAAEIGVPGGMPRVIRVMLLVNSAIPASKIRHQYLGDTPCLRPDLVKDNRATTRLKSSRRSSASTRTSAGGMR